MSLNVYAQFRGYKFVQTYSIYNELSNPVFLQKDTFWIDTSYKSLGYRWSTDNLFSFKFYGDTISSFLLTPYTKSGNKNLAMFLKVIGTKVQLLINLGGPFRAQEINNATPFSSSFSFEVDSGLTERILKFQFKNIGLADSNRLTTGILNEQIWLYDNGAVEYHFGEINAPDMVYYTGKREIKCGITAVNYDSSKVYSILSIGNNVNPRIYWLNSSDEYTPFSVPDSTLDVYPISGTIYRFYNSLLQGIGENQLINSISIFPNPFKDKIQVTNSSNKIEFYTVINSLGTTVNISNIFGNGVLSLEGLPDGMYYLKCTIGEELKVFKIVKHSQ